MRLRLAIFDMRFHYVAAARQLPYGQGAHLVLKTKTVPIKLQASVVSAGGGNAF